MLKRRFLIALGLALLVQQAVGQGLAGPPSSTFFSFHDPADFNNNIYYKDKLEFSLESGWLPNNTAFIFNFVKGYSYAPWPLHYTLVPNIASVRWHLRNVGNRSILRGNFELTFGGTYTAIVRGPETRYFAFVTGFRRNFVQRNWRIVPYFESRGGVGNINAKGPDGILYAQGQDLTFTLMMGTGARYNFNSRFSFDAGVAYDHISNFYLSQPAYTDYGLNVWGSFVGINVRIGKEKRIVP